MLVVSAEAEQVQIVPGQKKMSLLLSALMSMEVEEIEFQSNAVMWN